MLWLLMTFLYVQTGFQLGKKSAKTWKKGDSKSLESFLLFPATHARGKVGKGHLPFMGGINGAEATFRALVTLGWPVMVAWNALLVLGLLGPDKIIRRLTAGPPTFEERIKKILAEERKVDRVLRQLEAGEGNEPKRRKSKKAKALPAPAPTSEAEAEPGVSLDLLEAATPPGLYTPPAPQPVPAESAQPQVQVRVTVDVTAPGPAVEDADKGDEQPESRDAPQANASSERLVH